MKRRLCLLLIGVWGCGSESFYLRDPSCRMECGVESGDLSYDLAARYVYVTLSEKRLAKENSGKSEAKPEDPSDIRTETDTERQLREYGAQGRQVLRDVDHNIRMGLMVREDFDCVVATLQKRYPKYD